MPELKPDVAIRRIPEAKVYIGDGAYAELRYGDVILTAENGIEVTERIVLEPTVLRELLGWLHGHGLLD